MRPSPLRSVSRLCKLDVESVWDSTLVIVGVGQAFGLQSVPVGVLTGAPDLAQLFSQSSVSSSEPRHACQLPALDGSDVLVSQENSLTLTYHRQPGMYQALSRIVGS